LHSIPYIINSELEKLHVATHWIYRKWFQIFTDPADYPFKESYDRLATRETIATTSKLANAYD